MFLVEWKEGALRQLEKLGPELAKRVFKKVEELRGDPFSKDLKKLKGEKGFRMRIGDYRLIFDMDLAKSLITVLRIGHRKNIYK